MSQSLFLFGPLIQPGILSAVAGAVVETGAAHLPGHALCLEPDGDGPFAAPVAVPDVAAVVEGVLVRPTAVARARIEGWLRFLGYRATSVRVQTPDGVSAAIGWTRAPGAGLVPWDGACWGADHAALCAEAAPEILALLPALPGNDLAVRVPMILAHAASRLRARAGGGPAGAGGSTSASTAPARRVEVLRDRRPYGYFFGVAETDLRFERFDGDLGPPVRRAGFIMSDAVTVLPYDPRTDRVLLVAQFRYGAWLRTDPDPWLWEVIAGRVDPGEDPDQAARREAVEEARLTLRHLLPIGGHYPSPGAVSEYIHGYLGLTDLSPAQDGIAGLESEAEDIRARVLSFEAAMAMLDAGQIRNGPSQIALMWLALNRARLRAGQSPD